MEPVLRRAGLALVVVGALASQAHGQRYVEDPVTDVARASFPARPAEGTFVVDEADVVSPADEAAIATTAAAMRDRGAPLLVVTIRSLGAHAADHLGVEGYAAGLFREWGIGDAAASRGVLVLLSMNDRKARIELGTGWDVGKYAESDVIMSQQMVPAFRAGEHGRGLRVAAEQLGPWVGVDAPPPPAKPRSRVGLIVGGVTLALMVGAALSFWRRGTRGLAWRIGSGFFRGLFAVLKAMAASSGSSSSSYRSFSSSSSSSSRSSYSSSSRSSSSSSSRSSYGGGRSGGGSTGSW